MSGRGGLMIATPKQVVDGLSQLDPLAALKGVRDSYVWPALAALQDAVAFNPYSHTAAQQAVQQVAGPPAQYDLRINRIMHGVGQDLPIVGASALVGPAGPSIAGGLAGSTANRTLRTIGSGGLSGLSGFVGDVADVGTTMLASGGLAGIPIAMAREGGEALAERAARDVAESAAERAPTEFEIAHEVAQRNAALPKSKGGLGLPADNTAMQRAEAMGFVPSYHGSVGDIENFDKARRGLVTGAASAGKADFSSKSPMVAEGYAYIPEGRDALNLQMQIEEAGKSKDWDRVEALTERMEDIVYGRRNRINELSDQYDEARDNFIETVKKYGGQVSFSAGPAQKGLHPDIQAFDRRMKVLDDALDSAMKKVPRTVDTDALIRSSYDGNPWNWDTEEQFNAIADAIAKRNPQAADLFRAEMDGRWETMPEFQPNPEAVKELMDAYRKAASIDRERLSFHLPDGANVMPLMVRTDGLPEKDFGGSRYRDETYFGLLKEHGRKGGVVLRNTYDPANRNFDEMTDIYAITDPSRIRSRFAAFDPMKKKVADLMAGFSLPIGAFAIEEKRKEKKSGGRGGLSR